MLQIPHENREDIPVIKKENFNFKKRKENTVNSLFEVEHFLHDLKNVVKGVKMYKLIKW